MKHLDPEPALAGGKLEVLAKRCGYRARTLAEALGVSQRQLQREFRRHLQCGPQRWLHEERLRVAQALLRSAGSVKEVAYALGFTQPSQFCRDFKEHFGSTPSTWLRRRAGFVISELRGARVPKRSR